MPDDLDHVERLKIVLDCNDRFRLIMENFYELRDYHGGIANMSQAMIVELLRASFGAGVMASEDKELMQAISELGYRLPNFHYR